MTAPVPPVPQCENLAAVLERVRAAHGSRTAVSCKGRSFTYEELARRANSLAHVLRDEGAGAGVAAAVLHGNCHLVLEAYFAAAALGALLVPLNTRLSEREIVSILEDCEARVLICARPFESVARKALERMTSSRRPRLLLSLDARIEQSLDREALAPCGGGDDPAQLYYTSGTTGKPKGVILTHRNVASHARAAVAELDIDGKDVWLHAAPLFHLADAWATWAVTMTGGRHVVLPEFDAGAALDAIDGEGVTITNLIPTMLNRLVHHPDADRGRLKSMRRIMSGGAPMALELLKKIETLFPCEYVQTYGLTETSPYLTLSLLDGKLRSLPEEEQRRYRAMTGRPMRGVDVKVVDGTGREVPRDGRTVGEIMARGPTVTPGYFKQPEETRRAFDNGWLRTGDLAHVEARGFLTIVDRIKDVINTGGEQVYSIEVEGALFAHPAVKEAAVIAVPDDEWGEAVRAVVILREGAAASRVELIAFCRDCMAPFKVPRDTDIVKELPRTGSGKIDKKALREPFWKGREKRVH